MKALNIEQIQEIIPHRHPFLLVDCIEELEPENQGKIAFFGGVQNCRFKGMVFPGDKLKLETKIIKRKGPVGVGEAVASVNGNVVASAQLTFMVGE